MSTPILETERLRLRPLTMADTESLFSFYSDSESMRYMSTPVHTTIQETQAGLMIAMARSGAVHWAICLKENDEPIGIVNYLGETAIPGMGYLLKRDYWGRGYTAEACRAALDYGFESLGFDRVELWINEENHRSLALARKLGFRQQGKIDQKYPHESDYHLMLTFGMWREEWQGGTTPTQTRFFSFQPVLIAPDLGETLAFYRDKLGFEVDFTYGDPLDHAGVSYGSWTGRRVTIQLSQGAPGFQVNPSSYLYIFCDPSLDELCEQYRANGVTIRHEPNSYPWGLREFTIVDCNGYPIRFGTHI